MPHVHPSAIAPEGFSVSLTLMILAAALVYLRGWLRLRSTSNATAWRAAGFLSGLSAIWIAVASPAATSDHATLTGHMIQHLLLMTIAPPLIWLGAGPFYLGRTSHIKSRARARCALALCWLAATATLLVWHVPSLFALAMRSEAWHAGEQISFAATGLFFWWPVVEPWPNVAGWTMILYLFLATLPCDILSGFLVFSDRVAYPVYFSTSPQSGLSVLADQQCAGALMWTCVTIIYLVAATILATRLLSPQGNPQSVEAL